MRRSMREQRGTNAGRKKVAHYSAAMYSGTLPCSRRRPGARTRLACALALSASLAWPSGAAQGARPEAEASKAEAELKSIATEIERVTQEISEQQVERD